MAWGYGLVFATGQGIPNDASASLLLPIVFFAGVTGLGMIFGSLMTTHLTSDRCSFLSLFSSSQPLSPPREDIYQDVVQTQSEFILRSLPDTTITFANRALLRVLGLPLDKVVGLRWDAFVPAKDIEILGQKIRSLTPEMPSFENINPDFRLDGREGWTQWTSQGIFNHKGQLVEIQSVGRDITQLQRQLFQARVQNRILQAIHHCLDLETIFSITTTEIVALFPELRCRVGRYFPETKLWRTIIESDHQPTHNFDHCLESDISAYTSVLQQGQKVRVEIPLDPLADPPRQKACLLIPLRVDGELWGSLTIQHPVNWQEDLVSFIEMIGHQLEIAIQKVNLVSQLQQELLERQQVESLLRESEAQFQAMTANLPGAILQYILHPDGSDGVLYMNQGCYALWEVEAEQVQDDATLLWQMIHPEDLPGMYQSVMVSAQQLAPWSWSWRITPPSGKQKWLEAFGRPRRQTNGDIIWDSLILDVTDRKQAEQDLKASEARYRRLIETAEEGIWICDADHKTTFVNAKMATRLGYSPADMVGRSLADFMDPEGLISNYSNNVSRFLFDFMDPEGVIQATQNVERRRTGITEHYDFRFKHKDGSDLWVVISTSPVFDDNGQYTGSLSMITDITARKQAEVALQESENRFRRLFESTPKIAVQGYTSDRQVIYWNQASEVLYGYTQEEAIGQQLEDLIIPPDMRQQVIQNIQQWILTNTPIPAEELSLMRKDGSRVAVYSSHILLANSRGDRELYCVDIDLTEYKQMEHRFQTVADNIPGVVYGYRLRPDGSDQFTYITPRGFRDLYGFEATDALQDTQVVWRMIHPEDLNRVQNSVLDSYKTLKTWECQYRITTPAGHLKWLQGISRPSVQANGDVIWDGLIIDITQQKQAEIQLQNLIAGTAATTGQAFFPALVKHLSAAVHDSTAIVSQLVGDHLEVLALWSHGSLQPLFCYTQYDTPCEQVLREGKFTWIAAVQGRFPQDPDLVAMQAEGYIGIRLEDSQGKALGVLCLLSREPLQNSEHVESLLSAFATRAAAELERQRARESLEQLNQHLEATVKERTQSLQALLLNSPHLIYQVDSEGRYLQVNPSLARLFQIPASEMVGKTIADCLPAAQAKLWGSRLQELAQTHQPLRVAEEFVVSGEPRYFESVTFLANCAQDSQESPTTFWSIATDVTARKQAELELQKSHAHLRTAQRIAKLGSWEFNVLTQEIHWSEEVFRMFGRDPALPPPDFAELVSLLHPDDRSCHQEAVQRAIELQEPYTRETRFWRSDATWVYVQARGEPVVNDQGQVIQLVGTVLDITERKRTEMQLEASNRELEAFTYSVSHDLRAPLRHINGFVSALRQRLDRHYLLSDPKASHYLEVIEKSSQKMAQLIDGLLTLSRTSRKVMEHRPVPLYPLVQEAIALVQPASETRTPVEFVVGELPTVWGDATLLQQVMYNLIENAVKFSRHQPTPRIEIGTLSRGIFFIRDNGVGFQMEYADKLFGAFQRLHAQTEFEGTGIGLAIVQRIIHRHGGRIWAESQPHQGATFYFTLEPALDNQEP
jgi:PAS domain S-box-containing protein